MKKMIVGLTVAATVGIAAYAVVLAWAADQDALDDDSDE